MKAINLAKTYLRKRRDCLCRSKERPLTPLRISRKTLEQTRREYELLVDTLESRVRAYQPEGSKKLEKLPFWDYRILSYNGDQMGKVFEKDGRIFRGIYQESASWFQKLWDTGLIQTLGEAGYLPRTTVTDFATEDYPIILEHQVVSISTAKLWDPEMVRDACITVCIINAVCKRFGYKLIDGHLNNVTFFQGKPVFTDIGSIVEERGQYTAYETSLIFSGAYKLIFAAMGNSILSRIQLYDEDNNGIWITPMHYDDATYEYRFFLKKYRRYHLLHSTPLCSSIIFRLFELYDVRPEYIALLFPDTQLQTHEQHCTDHIAQDTEAVIQAMKKLGITQEHTVTDVGGTAGRLPAQLFETFGSPVTTFEHTQATAKLTYRYLKQKQLPINTYMYNYLYGADCRTRDAVRSDIAVALNITGNLCSYQNWKIESALNALGKLARDYVIVTYYPAQTAPHCVDSIKDHHGFAHKFREFFDIIDTGVIPSCSEEDGRIYVGRIRHH